MASLSPHRARTFCLHRALLVVSPFFEGQVIATRRSSAWLAHCCIIAFWMCAAIMAAPARAQGTPPKDGGEQFVVVQEEGKQISSTVEIAADGHASISFRVQALAGRDSVPLQFLPGELTAGGGLRVARSSISISIPPPAALGATPRDLTLSITGLVTPGDYSGDLQVYAPSGTGYQAIPVRLHAIKPIAPALASDSTGLTLRLARSCSWFTKLVLGEMPCREEFALSLASLGRTKADPTATMTLVGTDGSSLPVAIAQTTQPSVSYADSKLLLKIPSGSLSPGHYNGHIRASFDSGASLVDAPVAIDIRWPASIAFLIILLGVIVGRVQAFMTLTGNTIATTYGKLATLNARAARLHSEYRDALDPSFQSTFDLLDAEELERLATSVTLLDKSVRALEVVMALVPDPTSAPDAVKKLIGNIEADIKAGDAIGANALVEQLRTALTTAGPKSFTESTPRDRLGSPAPTTSWARVKTLVIVYGHGALFAVAVFFIALAGLQTLYVTNGAQLGSAPLTDILTLFAWGLASDVAGRTLTNFKG